MSPLEIIEPPPADLSCCRYSTKFVEPVKPSASRYAKLLQWLVPGAVLVLMPKCPACFAMYFALATGIGLTMSTAASLRIIIMLVCVVCPIVAAIGPTRRLLRRRLADRPVSHHQLTVS
jgi:hypothetical protein